MLIFTARLVKDGDEGKGLWSPIKLHADSQEHAEELCRKIKFHLESPELSQ